MLLLHSFVKSNCPIISTCSRCSRWSWASVELFAPGVHCLAETVLSANHL